MLSVCHLRMIQLDNNYYRYNRPWSLFPITNKFFYINITGCISSFYFRLENIHCSDTRATDDTRTRSSKLLGLSRDKSYMKRFLWNTRRLGPTVPLRSQHILWTLWLCCSRCRALQACISAELCCISTVYMALTFWVLVYTTVWLVPILRHLFRVLLFGSLETLRTEIELKIITSHPLLISYRSWLDEIVELTKPVTKPGFARTTTCQIVAP